MVVLVAVVAAVVATWQDASAAIKSEITHSYAAVKLGRIWHRHPSIGNSLELALPFLLSLALSLSLALACSGHALCVPNLWNVITAGSSGEQWPGPNASGATAGAGAAAGGVGVGVGLRTESQLTVQDGEISSHRQPRWRCAEHLHKSSPTRRKMKNKKTEKKEATTQNLTIFFTLACCLFHSPLPLSFSLCLSLSPSRSDEAHLMRADTKPRVKFNRRRSSSSFSLLLPSAHLTSRSLTRCGLECRPPGHLVRKSDSAAVDADAGAGAGAGAAAESGVRSPQSMPGALVSVSVSVSVFIF